MPTPLTTIRLRALEGAPLADPVVRETVIAAAHALAERNNVAVRAITAHDDHITATLELDRLASIGFAAELRRITNKWYAAKFKEPNLWGEHHPTDNDPRDPPI
ncbi:MAG TPA: hypothetical protein VG797_01290 [Phycisphaerales bacterium]|nr:hypothetical protein [Phycisphaerales bacterium]